MKRFVIIVGVLIVIAIGSSFLFKKSDQTSTKKPNLYEISSNQISKNLKTGAVIIDVRTSDEYKANHAVGAINIPVDDIENGKQPDANKDEIIYLYCRSGRRATLAKDALEKAGYKHVINLTSLYNWVAVLDGKTEGDGPTCTVDDKENC